MSLESLIVGTAKSLATQPGVAQVLGYFQWGKEGLHVAYEGKRYLVTFCERPEADGGMTLYEMGQEAQVWTPGRAFVLQEQGQVEYFYRFEEQDGQQKIRSVCGGLREIKDCRPLDYVCELKHLEILPK